MSGLGEFSTSYFSEPSPTLDPTLFEGRRLRSWVRQGIMQLLDGFYTHEFRHHELWSHPWLAGSGVSYQWSASRSPGDLDCLVGVDYIQFRKANPEYSGLNDVEVSQMINEAFREVLQPQTENWHGYELTFYVNPGATDIRSIQPYAAYSLKYDEWTVAPDPQQSAPSVPEWDTAVSNDLAMTKQLHTRYTSAVQDLETAHADATRRNAEVRLLTAKQQAKALFDEIHMNRRLAFGAEGEGYYDFHNYRWQAGKRYGVIQTLKQIRDHDSEYEVVMPDTATLIRRAATYRAKM